MNDETQEWISWARRKMDWFDPSVPSVPDELLNGIDIENLRRRHDQYLGCGRHLIVEPINYNAAVVQVLDNMINMVM